MPRPRGDTPDVSWPNEMKLKPHEAFYHHCIIDQCYGKYYLRPVLHILLHYLYQICFGGKLITDRIILTGSMFWLHLVAGED